ncbi:MAG: PIN domain-containing protein [Chloroherpetonaceae bacterium]|nr:PIN domain-containing protein [Chloroherpetonaceae bacterium]
MEKEILVKEQKRILANIESSRDNYFISAVSLMEILYLSEKKRIHLTLDSVLESIKESGLYNVIDLNVEILNEAQKLKLSELHDRMIVASAIWVDAAIISSDESFKGIKGLVVIWD